ncbi:hypothetical protein DLAC_00814 [Tieghemostelium lacteum]|uniref:Uncharacterized protein n=1 Tax=Tieghemostelium lacteum TaxID=361077 RepID=A0A152A721_TIELA|nr:hypothetical protein DLAC_00814 [Tieghemostelium lacteum]|eukprot:KYR02020.1 hypothetical protein DLAC_00814 [Tieghemostelium lacteum]
MRGSFRLFYIQKKKEQQKNEQNENKNNNNSIDIQRNNRSDEQFRQIFLKSGIVSQASGSCYIEIEKTKVLCSVHGPRASHKTEEFVAAKFNCELKYTTFSSSVDKYDYTENNKEKDQSLIIREALIGSVRLEKYPKTVIDIYILVLNDDGNVMVASITAASMALADAGVEMYDMVASCSSVCTKDRILLDPSYQEESLPNTTNILVAKMPALNQVTQLVQSGDLSYNTVIEAVDLNIDGCDKIYSIMKQNLIDSLEKQLKDKDNNNNNNNMDIK